MDTSSNLGSYCLSKHTILPVLLRISLPQACISATGLHVAMQWCPRGAPNGKESWLSNSWGFWEPVFKILVNWTQWCWEDFLLWKLSNARNLGFPERQLLVYSHIQVIKLILKIKTYFRNTENQTRVLVQSYLGSQT